MVPKVCPACSGPIEEQRIEYDDGSGRRVSEPGTWDCVARCYLGEGDVAQQRKRVLVEHGRR
jgi:hypothetical protein